MKILINNKCDKDLFVIIEKWNSGSFTKTDRNEQINTTLDTYASIFVVGVVGGCRFCFSMPENADRRLGVKELLECDYDNLDQTGVKAPFFNFWETNANSYYSAKTFFEITASEMQLIDYYNKMPMPNYFERILSLSKFLYRRL